MSKKYSLTEEHRAQLKPWAEKWIRNAMSTEPMSDAARAEAREHIKGLYRAAGLTPPPDHRIVFVADPFTMRFATGFAAWIWHMRKNGSPLAATRAATRDATDAATRDATLDATRDATRDATDAATRDATDAATYDATADATDDATLAATRAATRDATRAATRAATDDATADATRAATYDATWYTFPVRAMRGMAAALKIDPRAALWCAELAYRFWNGGNQWSAWAAFLSFFRHVAKLNLDYGKWHHYERLAEISGPRVLHAEFAMVCDRPRVLTVDAQNRPHNENGPFCEWSSGAALFSWHGVRVPSDVILHPKRITHQRITAERNAEVRRVMLERYGVDRYIRDSGAQELHRDRYGVLLRKELPDDEPIVMVAVKNSTPEPDGSIKDYFLRVHPELRPMLGGNRLGSPQAMTARNAVASTFGLTGEQYAPEVES